jgi:hypothetical protein
MLYEIDFLTFDHSRTVSIMFDPLGSSGLSLVMSDFLLDRLSMNNLVGKVNLSFYWVFSR